MLKDFGTEVRAVISTFADERRMASIGRYWGFRLERLDMYRTAAEMLSRRSRRDLSSVRHAIDETWVW